MNNTIHTDPPRSIQLFTVFFWLGTAVSAVADVYLWDRTMADIIGDSEIGSEPAILLEGVMIVFLSALYAVSVLLWFFTAEKRSRIAMWIYTILYALGALGFLFLLEEYALDEKLGYGASNLFAFASVICLFRRDARQWFAKKEAVDASTFE